MTYQERQALNALLANKQYYEARKSQELSTAIATPMGIDGTTGRSLVVAGDGIGRTNSIASSSQLGVTSAIAVGVGGNAGFSDGRSA